MGLFLSVALFASETKVITYPAPPTECVKSGYKVSVNGQKVDLASLSETILNLSPTETTEVYIMGDENVPYKTIVQIMDIVKILGLEQISLVTDIKKEL